MLTLTNRIDMRPGAVPLVIHLGQYDSDFSLVFELYSSAGNFTVESGTTAMIRGTKTDGNAYDADATINISAKTVTVAGSEQMTAAKGRNVYELVLKKGTKVLSTANFILDVERAAMDADTIASESVLKELNAIIAGAATATEAASNAASAADRAEDAAESVSSASTQIATNTADIADLKADFEQLEPGLSAEAKAALLACFRHVSFLDDDDDYYGELETALGYEPSHTYSLDAAFNPGNYVVYADDTLDSLIPYLTVTYYEDSIGTVVSSEDYTLSGTLSIGNNTITVSYNGLTSTFNVNAIDLYNVFRWEYKTDGSGNLLKHSAGMYDKVVTSGGREIAVGILTANSASNRRSWYVRKGKVPAYLANGTQTVYYPIPVPSTARKFTATITPNTDKMAVYLYKYTESPVYENYHYERINEATMVTGNTVQTFTPASNLFISILHRPAGDSYTQEPEFTIVFE